MTQTQAQARQPGGAAIKTHPSQRAGRQTGMIPTLTGRHGHSSSYVKSASLGPSSPARENPLHSNTVTQTRNQDTLKFRRTYPTAEG